ncbi:MAG: TPM domain-containing protein, partial [Candidatus Limnocylindria bacterium]
MGVRRFIRVASSAVFGLFWAVIIAFAVFGFPGLPSDVQRFPDPVKGQAVYDPAGAIDPDIEQALEKQIDAIKARSGAEIAIYVQIDEAATADSNLAAARALLDQWGVGRAGYDDGLVMLISFESNLRHGQAHFYAGAGFLRGYLSHNDLQSVFDQVVLPSAGQGQIGGGLIEAVN